MTSTASGSSSTAAVLNPVNPSIATTSTRSRHGLGRSESHCWKACFDRPSSMPRSDLAGTFQTAARELGATADPRLPRFVQLFLDAADVAAVRAFWVAALGYTHDRRDWNTDIYDPRRLNPVLVFQELDAVETERRWQRNRIHFELAVPSDLAQTRPRHDRRGRRPAPSRVGGSLAGRRPRGQRNGDRQWGMSSRSACR